jgi:hypothetical protein
MANSALGSAPPTVCTCIHGTGVCRGGKSTCRERETRLLVAVGRRNPSFQLCSLVELSVGIKSGYYCTLRGHCPALHLFTVSPTRFRNASRGLVPWQRPSVTSWNAGYAPTLSSGSESSREVVERRARVLLGRQTIAFRAPGRSLASCLQEPTSAPLA